MKSVLETIALCGAVCVLVMLCLPAPTARSEAPPELSELIEQLEHSSGNDRIDTLIELADRLVNQDVVKSGEYSREALGLARAAGDSSYAGKALWSLSRAHLLSQEYPQSLEHGLQALRLAEQLGDGPFHARVLNSLGTLHQKLRQYDDAARLYGRSLEITRSIGDRSGEARNLNSLGVNAWYQQDYEKAISCYEQCLNIQLDLGDRKAASSTLNNVAMIHHIRENYDEAIDNYEESLRIKRELGYVSGVAATLGNLGELYLSLERYPEALSQLEQSRDVAAEAGADEILVNSYYSLADYYEAVGNPAVALDNYRLANEREREVFSAKNTAAIAELQKQHEAEKNDLEIERLNLLNTAAAEDLAHQRRARDRLLAFLLIAIVMIGALAYLYRAKSLAHRRMKAQAKELEGAASTIAALTDLLPICAKCKKIRDAENKWYPLESYFAIHSNLKFTHGFCPKCADAVLTRAEES